LAGASPAPPDDTRTRSDVPPTRRAPADGLTLPGGSWLDLGLASAIAAAAALVWALRRRRYRPHPPSAQLRLDDPDMTPMPLAVDQIRRRLRRLTDGGGTEHITSAPPIKRTEPIQHVNIVDVAASAGSPVEGDAAVAGPSGSRPDDQPCDEDLETGDEDPSQYDQAFQGHDGIGMGDQPTAQPTYPSLTHPMIAIWPPAGLGLTGAGAHAAARGMLTAALAAGGVDTPGERSRVIMTSAAMTTLLGEDTTTQAPTPRLTVTAGIDEALALLEEQLLHRSRLLYAHEVDTLAEMRVADPTEEPLPPVMLLAESGDRERRTRVAALLAQGRRLDIHGVLLGAWPDGNTLLVAPDGTTSPADGDSARDGAHPADIGRLAVLTPDETSDLLRILAESHTGQQSTTAAAEPAVITTGDSHARTAGGYHQPDTGQARPAPPAASSPQPAATGAAPELQEPDADNTNAASGAGVQPTHREPAQQTAVRVDASPAGVPGPDPAVAGPGGYRVGERRATEGADGEEVDETGASGCGARAQITVLGTAGIAGLPVGIAPRKKSLEALVYLAVHDGEATAEAILDDVLGDAPASKASGRLYTYISDLRTVLRRVAGHATYISHPGQRYVLDHDLVDVDLWRMQAAIRDAALAADPQQRQSALRRAVDTYAGPLADGADYEWIEPYREAVRQQALDAALALAGTLAETPAEQIAVLDTAIRHNPYTEQLYQQAMRTRARLGHLDAIRTLRRAVTRALDEIDAEPTDDTIALADELVSQLQRTNHPRSPRAPRPAEGAAA
jgi:DNA-binding SARP family transcriptional activator